eukprot:GGOE01019761.1.p1 GENE.GGOE01019761.1~~GGOE01019761.1.p1  ORF type:complete len:201 (+),score=35.68 GGOE01019761.1:100-702(+)
MTTLTGPPSPSRVPPDEGCNAENDPGEKLRQLLATVEVPACQAAGPLAQRCSSCCKHFSSALWTELCFRCRRGFCKWCLVKVNTRLQCHQCHAQVQRAAVRLSALQIAEADTRFWTQCRCLLPLQELHSRCALVAHEGADWGQMHRFAHNYFHFLEARQGLVNRGMFSLGSSAVRSVSCLQKDLGSSAGQQSNRPVTGSH